MDMKLIFDYFSNEELDLPGTFPQLLSFEYDFCFIEPLVGVISADEAHTVYVADQDMRMEDKYAPQYPYIIKLDGKAYKEVQQSE